MWTPCRPPSVPTVGLRNPGRPIAAPDYGAALINIGLWQSVLYIAWRGSPVAGLTQHTWRLLGGNAIVLGGGAATYLELRNLAHLQPTAISAVWGCAITAVLIVAMLFEHWLASRLAPAPGRAARPDCHRGSRPGPRANHLRA
jgi:hypothetical protein